MTVLDKLSVPVNNENHGTLMPKLQYRFRVTFVGMSGGSDNIDGGGSHVTNSVINVSRPSLSFDPVQIETYNSRIYLAGKHTWEQISIEMRDDVNSLTSASLDRQLARQIDTVTQSAPRAANSYKFQVNVENLNGGNPNPDVLDEWRLYGCYIANLRYNQSDYGTSDFQRINVDIRYDNAEHMVYNNGGTGTNYLGEPTYIPEPDSVSSAT